MNKPTIEELEKILANGEPLDIEIQPDGSIKSVPKGIAKNAKNAKNAKIKPLTLKHVVNIYY